MCTVSPASKDKVSSNLPSGLYLVRARGAFESSDPEFLNKFMSLDKVESGFFGDITVHRSPKEEIQAVQFIQSDGFQITISGNMLQYELAIPQDKRNSPIDSMKFLENRLKGLFRELKSGKLGSVNWAGVIFHFALPIASANSAASAVEQWLKNLKSPILLSDNLAMFKFQHGYREGGFNHHIFVDGYQIQHAQLNPQQSNVDLHKLQATAAVVEAGVEFVLDVNDKPQRKRGSLSTKFRAVRSHIVDNYPKWIDWQIKSFEGKK